MQCDCGLLATARMRTSHDTQSLARAAFRPRSTRPTSENMACADVTAYAKIVQRQFGERVNSQASWLRPAVKPASRNLYIVGVRARKEEAKVVLCDWVERHGKSLHVRAYSALLRARPAVHAVLVVVARSPGELDVVCDISPEQHPPVADLIPGLEPHDENAGISLLGQLGEVWCLDGRTWKRHSDVKQALEKKRALAKKHALAKKRAPTKKRAPAKKRARSPAAPRNAEGAAPAPITAALPTNQRKRVRRAPDGHVPEFIPQVKSVVSMYDSLAIRSAAPSAPQLNDIAASAHFLCTGMMANAKVLLVTVYDCPRTVPNRHLSCAPSAAKTIHALCWAVQHVLRAPVETTPGKSHVAQVWSKFMSYMISYAGRVVLSGERRQHELVASAPEGAAAVHSDAKRSLALALMRVANVYWLLESIAGHPQQHTTVCDMSSVYSLVWLFAKVAPTSDARSVGRTCARLLIASRANHAHTLPLVQVQASMALGYVVSLLLADLSRSCLAASEDDAKSIGGTAQVSLYMVQRLHEQVDRISTPAGRRQVYAVMRGVYSHTVRLLETVFRNMDALRGVLGLAPLVQLCCGLVVRARTARVYDDLKAPMAGLERNMFSMLAAYGPVKAESWMRLGKAVGSRMTAWECADLVRMILAQPVDDANAPDQLNRTVLVGTLLSAGTSVAGKHWCNDAALATCATHEMLAQIEATNTDILHWLEDDMRARQVAATVYSVMKGYMSAVIDAFPVALVIGAGFDTRLVYAIRGILAKNPRKFYAVVPWTNVLHVAVSRMPTASARFDAQSARSIMSLCLSVITMRGHASTSSDISVWSFVCVLAQRFRRQWEEIICSGDVCVRVLLHACDVFVCIHSKFPAFGGIMCNLLSAALVYAHELCAQTGSNTACAKFAFLRCSVHVAERMHSEGFGGHAAMPIVLDILDVLASSDVLVTSRAAGPDVSAAYPVAPRPVDETESGGGAGTGIDTCEAMAGGDDGKPTDTDNGPSAASDVGGIRAKPDAGQHERKESAACGVATEPDMCSDAIEALLELLQLEEVYGGTDVTEALAMVTSEFADSREQDGSSLASCSRPSPIRAPRAGGQTEHLARLFVTLLSRAIDVVSTFSDDWASVLDIVDEDGDDAYKDDDADEDSVALPLDLAATPTELPAVSAAKRFLRTMIATLARCLGVPRVTGEMIPEGMCSAEAVARFLLRVNRKANPKVCGGETETQAFVLALSSCSGALAAEWVRHSMLVLRADMRKHATCTTPDCADAVDLGCA